MGKLTTKASSASLKSIEIVLKCHGRLFQKLEAAQEILYHQQWTATLTVRSVQTLTMISVAT